MDIRLMRYFLAIAQEENITKAAKILHISQPSLSKQMMDLENELGVKLFERGNRKVYLTEDGMFFRKRAQEIIQLTDKMMMEFELNSEIIEGDVYIGAGETDKIRVIGQVLKNMEEKGYDIRFHIQSGNGIEIKEQLKKGLIDFALFIGDNDLSEFDYVKLKDKDRWGILAPFDHPLAEKEFILAKDLEDIPLIFTQQALTSNELSGWFKKPMDKLNVVGTYNLMFNAASMAKMGLGVVVGLDDIILDPMLKFVPLDPKIEADIYIAWKKYPSFSKAAAKFMENLKETASQKNQ